MKKTTTKTSKSLAPAKKAAPVAAARVAPAAPAAAARKKSTPKVKAVATAPIATTITAKIDIGFGNTLHIRGEGPGLSWDRGLVMNCVADDQWQVVLVESARPVVFKFLVNDLSWSTGEDYTVESGASLVIEPTF